jgi:hypothetical protein
VKGSAWAPPFRESSSEVRCYSFLLEAVAEGSLLPSRESGSAEDPCRQGGPAYLKPWWVAPLAASCYEPLHRGDHPDHQQADQQDEADVLDGSLTALAFRVGWIARRR